MEADYPYVSGSTGNVTACQYENLAPSNISVSTWNYVQQKDGTQLKAALATGPVGIGINASPLFSFYKSGIFDCSPSVCLTNMESLNHAVLLVGYGVQDGTEYFILKN